MPKAPTVRSARPLITPAKVVKTERTHEENQERAYVAASRRSDRSIEARVESAHRASEIHKRRTGRGFKITIKAVQDEEMYEEEDDLPLRYRQVTNHLYSQGQPSTMNGRLDAYLTANIAMREFVISNMESGQQSLPGYSNPAQLENQGSMAMPPTPTHLAQYLQPQQSRTAMYRHAPYPTPRAPPTQQPPPVHHQRSASYASPMGPVQQSPVAPVVDYRRMSMPAAIPTSVVGSPMDMHTPASAPSAHSTPQQRPAMISSESSAYGQPQAMFQSQPQPQQQHPFMTYNNVNNLPANYNPFTGQLPPNAQGMLGSTLNPNDPYTQIMMAGSGNLTSSYYDFGPQSHSTLQQPNASNVVGHQTHPTLHGLGSTLAPSAFDIQSPGFDMQLGSDQPQSYFNDAFRGIKSEDATPAGTPGDNPSWAEEFMADPWSDIPGSQESQQ